MFDISQDRTNERKETLQKWGIVKSNRDLRLFYELAPMLAMDKINEYGARFFEDIITIIRLRTKKAIIRFIKRTRSKRNQILLGDTFLAIRAGFQTTIAKDCPNRLMDLCSIKGEPCNFSICDKVQEIMGSFREVSDLFKIYGKGD